MWAHWHRAEDGGGIFLSLSLYYVVERGLWRRRRREVIHDLWRKRMDAKKCTTCISSILHTILRMKYIDNDDVL